MRTATSAHWNPGTLLETFSSTNALIGYLWFFGIAMILAGFAFWNGLGPAFGILRRNSVPVESEP